MTIVLTNDQVGKEVANMIAQLYNVPSSVQTAHPNDTLIAKSVLACLSRKTGLSKYQITKNINTNNQSHIALNNQQTGIHLHNITIDAMVLPVFEPYMMH